MSSESIPAGGQSGYLLSELLSVQPPGAGQLNNNSSTVPNNNTVAASSSNNVGSSIAGTNHSRPQSRSNSNSSLSGGRRPDSAGAGLLEAAGTPVLTLQPEPPVASPVPGPLLYHRKFPVSSRSGRRARSPQTLSPTRRFKVRA